MDGVVRRALDYAFFGDHVRNSVISPCAGRTTGQVTFSEIEGGRPDDEVVWTVKPFVRVDDPATPHRRSSSGSGRRHGNARSSNSIDRQLDSQTGSRTGLTFELQPSTRGLDPLDESLETRTR